MKRSLLSVLLALALLLSGCGLVLDQPPAETAAQSGGLVVETLPPETETPGGTPAPALPAETEAPAPTPPPETPYPDPAPSPYALDEDGEYTSETDVAAYIHTFGHLPSNYITKSEAQALGWPGGDLWRYAPGKSIGGDRFGNYEGLLPKGRYRECDVNYAGGSRGAARIVYGEDGGVWYTDDHYESFTRLY